MDTVNNAGGNTARIYTNDGNNNNEAQKKAVFTVYEMYNGGKYNEVTVEGRKTVEALETAVTGQYYYTVKRNGAEMTYFQHWVPQYVNLENVTDDVAIGNGNSLIVNFTANKAFDGALAVEKQAVIGADSKQVVSLNYWDVYGGAGTYEFILWEVVENSKTGELEYARKLSKTVSTSYDAGSYAFKERLAVTIDVENNADRNEMSQKLLGCFKIADRTNATYDKDATSWNNIVDGTKVNMGGHQKLYYVNYRWANASETSVYVENIFFFEKVATDAGVDVYMEYNVPVGYYVTVK